MQINIVILGNTKKHQFTLKVLIIITTLKSNIVEHSLIYVLSPLFTLYFSL